MGLKSPIRSFRLPRFQRFVANLAVVVRIAVRMKAFGAFDDLVVPINPERGNTIFAPR